MSDRKKLGVQRAYFVMATMFVATSGNAGAIVVNADVDIGEGNTELLQTLFKQLDMLDSKGQDNSKALSQSDSKVASSALQAAPSVTIKGNITDPERRITLTFTVQVSRSFDSSASLDDDDDDEEGWVDDWRSSTGVLTPIVGVVEPYVLGFVELVFNGILSSVISNFLEGSNLLGDVRLV